MPAVRPRAVAAGFSGRTDPSVSIPVAFPVAGIDAVGGDELVPSPNGAVGSQIRTPGSLPLRVPLPLLRVPPRLPAPNLSLPATGVSPSYSPLPAK